MNKYKKLLERFNSKPNDFTFEEAKKLLSYSDFKLVMKGHSSGSRVQFRCDNVKIDLHRPHPKNYLKKYQLEDIEESLKKAGKL
ncbi:uncharacterized protein JF73_17800 (plasmid) [Lactobacillus helsingborgensis]|uniref:Type II toxin-antitoxin system HicA family toxin n=2 Tax=Lactobacillus TaxID=1578 RepID=A0AA47B5J2_9LACO|nr:MULTISPECIES: type II toxin-antitoxin system HicA family toxin [Lactobacillus]KJY54763.1 uncharacterized protein JF74_19460 [Lactobacillus melliventris]KJY60600.1 uncharacterized protein JF73_17800 [Lactobacillus helsingborgensis]UZX30538.1 type II toxin-antitoxin system HicA family toxin [Lactobacillus helsingborgensis]